MKHIHDKNRILIYIFSFIVVAGLLFLYFSTKGTQYGSLQVFDFSLRYGNDGQFGVSTFDDTISMTRPDGKTETLDYTIPVRIRRRVYLIMMDVGFMDYPESIDSGRESGSTDKYSFSVNIDGVSKIVKWENGLPSDTLSHLELTRDQLDFLHLARTIIDHITKTEEYRNLVQETD